MGQTGTVAGTVVGTHPFSVPALSNFWVTGKNDNITDKIKIKGFFCLFFKKI